MSSKWNTSGALTWTTNEVLKSSDLNDSIGDVFVPIGGVIAWLKSLSSVPAITQDWVECNGQTLSDSDSPLNGITIPDLNGNSGSKRFIRGSQTSGTIGGADSHNHTLHTSPVSSGSNTAYWGVTNTVSNLPEYYEVVWIMRVK